MIRGTLVDQGRNHDVLECHSGTVEHESVTRRLPGWLPADDDFSEFGVHVAALRGTCGERMVEVADRGRLIQYVDHDMRRRQQSWIDLLLVRIIGAHGRDERAGRDIVAVDDRPARGRARDDDVAAHERSPHISARKDGRPDDGRHLERKRPRSAGSDVVCMQG